MSKLDVKKEYITTLRIYLGFILAVILSIGTGLVKMYLSADTSVLFYIGIILIFVAIFIFYKINDRLHKEIENLKDL